MHLIEQLREARRGISKYTNYILNYLARDQITALFLILFLVAWFMNAITKVHLDQDMLLKGYAAFKTAHLFEYTVNSKYNSAEGEPYVHPQSLKANNDNPDKLMGG